MLCCLVYNCFSELSANIFFLTRTLISFWNFNIFISIMPSLVTPITSDSLIRFHKSLLYIVMSVFLDLSLCCVTFFVVVIIFSCFLALIISLFIFHKITVITSASTIFPSTVIIVLVSVLLFLEYDLSPL